MVRLRAEVGLFDSAQTEEEQKKREPISRRVFGSSVVIINCGFFHKDCCEALQRVRDCENENGFQAKFKTAICFNSMKPFVYLQDAWKDFITVPTKKNTYLFTMLKSVH